MGLDDAEIIMEIEDEFDVMIPDSAPWSRSVTVGEICNCVQAILDKKAIPCVAAKHFKMFRKALMAKTGLAKREIRPSTPLSIIVPRKGRRGLYKALSGELKSQGYLLPSLEWMKSGCVFSVVFCLIPGTYGLYLLIGSGRLSAMVLGAALLAGAFVTNRILDHVFYVDLPRQCRTAGDLARRIQPEVSEEDLNRACAREHISAKIINIISEQLQIPQEEVTLESRLYDDLGAG